MEAVKATDPKIISLVTIILAIVLTIVKPLLEANGVSTEWLSALLEALGFTGIASIRASVPAPNGWKTYGALVLGMLNLLAGLVDIISMPTALAAGTTILGLAAIGLRSATVRSEEMLPEHIKESMRDS